MIERGKFRSLTLINWNGFFARTFDLDELVSQAEVTSARMYYRYANSQEFGDKNVRQADDLLADIVAKADAALAPDSRRAADLRFGHDTGRLPLACLMGVSGVSYRCPTDGSWEHWATCDRIPMASNLQMVFYRFSPDWLTK